MPTPLIGSLVDDLKTPAEPSGYPKNWDDISDAFRKKCEYKCAVCGVDCSAHRHLIDAHHINGVKSDCRYENLQCLCKYCHSKQEFHSHYKVKEEDLQTLRQLWKEQNIDINKIEYKKI